MSYLENKDRFYLVKGKELVSVTTILSVISKPALMVWAAKAEREFFKAELEPFLKNAVLPTEVLSKKLDDILASPLQANVLKNKAAEIGSKAHALIEWEIRGMLGQKRGERPAVPETSYRAFEAWKEWAASVQFKPLEAEQQVYSLKYGYAGTMDLYAKINRKLTVLDWKTSKAVYPESYLQNIAYRTAALEMGKPSEQGIIIRLPKNEGDPGFEAVNVPPETAFDDFLAAFALWKFQERYPWKKKEPGKIVPVVPNPFTPTPEQQELADFVDKASKGEK